MKIALDEHIPPVLVKVFNTFATEGDVLSAQFVAAKSYGIPKAKSDVPWIQKFAMDGGTVVVSGDKAMRGNLHEQAALIGAGMITVFFHPRWARTDPFVKTAMLLKWWPVVQRTLARAHPGQFFEIPFAWNGDELTEVTPPKALRKPGRAKKRAAEGTEHPMEQATPQAG